jgi:hypothetical protein
MLCISKDEGNKTTGPRKKTEGFGRKYGELRTLSATAPQCRLRVPGGAPRSDPVSFPSHKPEPPLKYHPTSPSPPTPLSHPPPISLAIPRASPPARIDHVVLLRKVQGCVQSSPPLVRSLLICFCCCSLYCVVQIC